MNARGLITAYVKDIGRLKKELSTLREQNEVLIRLARAYRSVHRIEPSETIDDALTVAKAKGCKI